MLNKGAFGASVTVVTVVTDFRGAPAILAGLRSAEPNIHGDPSSIGNHGNHGNHGNRTPSPSLAGYRA